SAALSGTAGGAASQICEVSAGKQTLSRSDRAGGSGRDVDRRVYDVSGTHAILHPQPVPVWRYDLGIDVCAARTGGCRIDRPGHGGWVIFDSGGKSSLY